MATNVKKPPNTAATKAKAAKRLSIVSLVIAIFSAVGGGASAWYTARSYYLNLEQDVRNQNEKLPVIDLELSPGTQPELMIMEVVIKNQDTVNIRPQAIEASQTLFGAPIYIYDEGTNKSKLSPISTSVGLLSMGTIEPKGTAKLKLIISTGQPTFLPPGTELEFKIHIRFADRLDTIRAIPIKRKISFG